MYGTPGTSSLVEESMAFPAYGDQPQRDGAQHDGTSAASSSWHGGVKRVRYTGASSPVEISLRFFHVKTEHKTVLKNRNFRNKE